jgi:hypothetical protein
MFLLIQFAICLCQFVPGCAIICVTKRSLLFPPRPIRHKIDHQTASEIRNSLAALPRPSMEYQLNSAPRFMRSPARSFPIALRLCENLLMTSQPRPMLLACFFMQFISQIKRFLWTNVDGNQLFVCDIHDTVTFIDRWWAVNAVEIKTRLDLLGQFLAWLVLCGCGSSRSDIN